MSNYTGPVWVNDAFNAWPHIQLNTFRDFGPVNPVTVNDDLSGYGWSIVFVPTFVCVALVIYSIGTCVSLCCRHCTCCDEDRERCNCECCPKKCCSPLTFNPNNPDACILGLGITFAALGIVVACLAQAYQIYTQNAVISATDSFLKLNDLSDQNKAELAQASEQMKFNSEEIIVLFNNSTKQGVNITDRLHLISALTYTQFARDGLAEASDNANVSLDIKSNADYSRNVMYMLNVALSLYFALLIGMLLGTWLAAFLPTKPTYIVIVTFEAVKASFLGVLAFLVLLGATTLTFGGDVCQDPNGYINQRNTDTSDSNYLSFYVNCPPGAESPQLPSLQLALNSTLLAQGEMAKFTYAMQVNGSFPLLLADSIAIQAGLNVSEDQINALIAKSGCDRVHAIYVEAVTTTCHSVMGNLAVWIFALPCTLLLFLFVDCVMPRAPYATEYTKLARTTTPPSPPTAATAAAVI